MICDWQVIARRLKEQREKRGLSHVELSKLLEEKYNIQISRDSLMAYEVSEEQHTKKRKNLGMRIEYLIYLADFYGVSADYLLGLSKVASIEMDTRAVCEYTGLSEKAAENLIGIKEYGPKISLEVLNYILENENQWKAFSDKAELHMESLLADIGRYFSQADDELFYIISSNEKRVEARGNDTFQAPRANTFLRLGTLFDRVTLDFVERTLGKMKEGFSKMREGNNGQHPET